MQAVHKKRNTHRLMASALIVPAILIGCSGDSDSGPETSSSASQPVELRGIWERTGYGDVVVVGESGADVFQITRLGCVQSDPLNNDAIADIFSEPELSLDGTSLITKSIDNLPFDTQFERLAALPGSCEPDALITGTTPTVAFDVLWNTFNDYYAFFNERSVDWDAQFAAIRPLVDDSLSDDELLDVFTALLEPLDDGHVLISDGDEIFSFDEERGFNRALLEGFEEQDEFSDIQDFADSVGAQFVAIRSSYLDEGSSESAGGENGRRVSWGTINQEVGFLRVSRMEDITTNGDDSVDANLNAINTIMQLALTDLQDTRAMIIDVRSNPGGEDIIGLAIANYFTDETRLVASKSARNFAGATDIVEAFISPANDTPYLNPVVVIASSDTGSAAEVFLLAMNALPSVTLVGENSNGIFSNILSKSLPNGVEFGLSNEVYTDFQGINYEGTGISPDVEAEIFSIEAIERNTDPAINAALETLGF